MDTPPKPVIGHEIKSLTGLRGIAACLVMLHHFLGYHLGPSRLATMSVHLYLCVDLFFVLSGFVMAMNYGAAFEPRMSFLEYRKFLGRRLARIYPLYFFATILYAALFFAHIMPANGSGNLIWACFTNIFLITAWGFGPYIIAGPAWSISTEWGAYLLFPFAARLTLFSRPYIAAAFWLFDLSGPASVGLTA